MTTAGYAAIVEELNGKFAVRAVEFDEPRGREVLVEVRAAGLCHSDLNVASIDRGRRLPLIPGHELAGVVLAVGPDVRTLRAGDHVVGTEVRACGECAKCLAGKVTLCEVPDSLERGADDPARVVSGGEHIFTLGVSAFASHSIADERQFVRVADELPFEQACLLACGVTTGVGAVQNVARVAEGESVAVFGLGGVGLNMISGAKLSGAGTIIAVDVDPKKLEIAQRFGATHTIESGANDPAAAIGEVLPGGVDHVFDAVGITAVTESALTVTARGGCLYLIGIPKPGQNLTINTLPDIIGAQRGIRGVYMGGSTPTRDLPLYAEHYLNGRLPLDELISELINIDEVNRSYAAPAAGGARAVITNFVPTQGTSGTRA